MPVEVENELKYVLRMNFNQQSLAGWDRTEIVQGWTPPRRTFPFICKTKQPRLRNESGEFSTNVKTWNHAINADDEDENTITERAFNRRWKHCTKKLQKTRYSQKIDDEKWVVDFFKRKNGDTYFVMAEVEMPVGRETPNHIPDIIKDATLYAPAKNDKSFKSKALSSERHAKLCYAASLAHNAGLS